MKRPDVITNYVNPPIPMRGMTWNAHSSDYDGMDGGLIGWGATEEEAISDYLELLATSCRYKK